MSPPMPSGPQKNQIDKEKAEWFYQCDPMFSLLLRQSNGCQAWKAKKELEEWPRTCSQKSTHLARTCKLKSLPSWSFEPNPTTTQHCPLPLHWWFSQQSVTHIIASSKLQNNANMRSPHNHSHLAQFRQKFANTQMVSIYIRSCWVSLNLPLSFFKLKLHNRYKVFNYPLFISSCILKGLVWCINILEDDKCNPAPSAHPSL